MKTRLKMHLSISLLIPFLVYGIFSFLMESFLTYNAFIKYCLSIIIFNEVLGNLLILMTSMDSNDVNQ